MRNCGAHQSVKVHKISRKETIVSGKSDCTNDKKERNLWRIPPRIIHQEKMQVKDSKNKIQRRIPPRKQNQSHKQTHNKRPKSKKGKKQETHQKKQKIRKSRRRQTMKTILRRIPSKKSSSGTIHKEGQSSKSS